MLNRISRRTGARSFSYAVTALLLAGTLAAVDLTAAQPETPDPLSRAIEAGKKIVVLVDGRKPADPHFNLKNIPLHKIERIEVLPATAAAAYGAEAADGLYNIILK